jgi:hypothetical protein
MHFKKSFLLSLFILFISCSTTNLENGSYSKKIIGKFSMFSENTYISGKISIFNQKEISQIKINLDRYPKTFLVTEVREGNQKKINSNFNESYEENTVKNLIEEITISRFSKWLSELCNLNECKEYATQNVTITKEEIYANKKIKKIVGSYNNFKFAVIFKS